MLPIEDRAVRTAQMDTEGHNIGEAINGAQTAIAALQEAVSGVVAFDGEVEVHYDGNNYYINVSDYPQSDGVYLAKIDNAHLGFIIYRFISGPNLRATTYIANNGAVWRGDAVTDDKVVLHMKSIMEYYQTSPQWDTTPTENSTKPVTSGGVYADLAGAGGTKLYVHNIVATFAYTYDDADISFNMTLRFISNYSTSINATQFKNLVYYNKFNKCSIGTAAPDAIWMYLDDGNRVGVGGPPSILDSMSSNFFMTGEFNRVGGICIMSSYPGANPTVNVYTADKIDLTTGEMVTRTNLASASSVTFVSDTVTAL